MSACVLDASALLALLKNEPGAEIVADTLADARMSAVNWAEVVSHFVYAAMPPLEIMAMLRPLPVTVVAADKALGMAAGALRAVTAEVGLSLGDRFCLALALRDRVPAITADRQWRLIADAVGSQIVCIR